MSAPRRQLVVATRNEHKLSELSEVLTGFDLLPLDADIVLPPEDGSTFAENSLG
ncbi:MAG: non-canonical purine NTP pyrophosphatase, partial [Thermoleophilia bacterium]|nr:non-canonical purine NTP pyrophosphatase [Thermoleophilia bacterium]